MLHQQIASNKRRTIVVIALYMVLLIAVGIGIGWSNPCCSNWWNLFIDDDFECDKCSDAVKSCPRNHG